MTLRTRRRLVTVMSGSMAGGAPPVDAPGGVEAGLGAWYKADSLALANGSPVTSWSDSGPNDLDLGAPGTPPVFVTPSVNNLPVLAFAGSYLNRGGVLGSLLAGTSASTVYVVQIDTGVSGNTFMWPGLEINTNQFSAYLSYNLPPQSRLFTQGNALGPGRITAAIPPGWKGSTHLTELWRSGAAGEISTEGSALSTGTFSDDLNETVTDTLWVGFDSSATSFTGYIAELIIYNRALTAPERGSVRAYLLAKYGIAENKILDESADGSYLLLEDANASGLGRLAMEA